MTAPLTIEDVMSFLENTSQQEGVLAEPSDQQWGIHEELLSPSPGELVAAVPSLCDALAVDAAAGICLGGACAPACMCPPGAGALAGLPLGYGVGPRAMMDPGAGVPGLLGLRLPPQTGLNLQVQPPTAAGSLASPSSLSPDAATAGGVPLIVPVNDPTVPTERMAMGNSHICTFAGCGKGFASRWSLERHMRNHENQELDHAEDADSFVERRLRERLRAAETALERTRERLVNAERHHGELRAEIDGKVVTTDRQEKDLKEIMLTNMQLAQSLATTNPIALRNVAEVCARGDGLAPPGTAMGAASTQAATAPAPAGRDAETSERAADGNATTRSQPPMPALLAAAGLLGPGASNGAPASGLRGRRQP